MPNILHVGCGPFKHSEYVNTDKNDMDITLEWPHQDSSVDAVVSQHVFQELVWRDLVHVFREVYRVLKRDGVLRFGVPEFKRGDSLQLLLGWGNQNILTLEILDMVLKEVGFRSVSQVSFQKTNTTLPVTHADNRNGETLFIEAIK